MQKTFCDGCGDEIAPDKPNFSAYGQTMHARGTFAVMGGAPPKIVQTSLTVRAEINGEGVDCCKTCVMQLVSEGLLGPITAAEPPVVTPSWLRAALVEAPSEEVPSPPVAEEVVAPAPAEYREDIGTDLAPRYDSSEDEVPL